PSSLIFFITAAPPTSPLFPYTTLFRSKRRWRPAPQRGPLRGGSAAAATASAPAPAGPIPFPPSSRVPGPPRPCSCLPGSRARTRSEEHTSELPSLTKLLFPLLLGKKKT